jgi:hypothetical protein
MMGIVPSRISQRPDKTRKHDTQVGQQAAHTHSNAHAEQTTDNLIDDRIQVLVAGLPAVDLVVCIISKAQAEEIWFCDNKVEILVKDLRDVLRCTGSGYL